MGYLLLLKIPQLIENLCLQNSGLNLNEDFPPNFTIGKKKMYQIAKTNIISKQHNRNPS